MNQLAQRQHPHHWALIERDTQRLIMRGSWATVQQFGKRFIEAGISVDYRREVAASGQRRVA